MLIANKEIIKNDPMILISTFRLIIERNSELKVQDKIFIFIMKVN